MTLLEAHFSMLIESWDGPGEDPFGLSWIDVVNSSREIGCWSE